IDFEAGIVDYGEHAFTSKGLGDPLTVDKHTRPITDSVEKWATELAAEPAKLQMVREMTATIDDADLDLWGFPRATFFAPVDQAAVKGGGRLEPPPRLDRFRIERKLLVLLRRNIHQNAFGRVVRRTRMLCDVLLRG